MSDMNDRLQRLADRLGVKDTPRRSTARPAPERRRTYTPAPDAPKPRPRPAPSRTRYLRCDCCETIAVRQAGGPAPGSIHRFAIEDGHAVPCGGEWCVAIPTNR